MKIQLYLYSLILFIHSLAAGSPERSICSRIEYYLIWEVTEASGNIPTKWEDFSIIRENVIEKDDFIISIINSFVLIPGNPEIKQGNELPNKITGKKIFLMSRSEIQQNGKIGRLCIFINKYEKSKKHINTEILFIPAKQSRAILNQLPGFDPIEAPAAFENFYRAPGGGRERLIREKEEQAASTRRKEWFRDHWIVFPLLVGFVGFIIWRLKTRNSKV